MNTPRELAINLIKSYVLRGDSLDSLKRSYMGQGCSEYSVAICGNAWNGDELVHKGKIDEIVVSRVSGKDCCYVFKLEELFNEIKSNQMSFI